MNNLKTVVLLAAISGLLVAIGGAVGGVNGVVLFAVIAAAMNLGSYWFSADLVLRSAHAREIQRGEDPALFALIEEVAQRAEMPMPRVYLMDSAQPNAFATGRSPKHASVAVTSGLLELMKPDELEGVLAHELSHVKNRDTLVMTVAAALAGAIMYLARMAQWSLWMGGGRSRDNRNSGSGAFQIVVMLLIAILAPLAAMLIQLAISRTREYGADATGAKLAGNPFGLAAALEKLEAAKHAYPLPNANPATAHLFIVNPLSAGAIAGLFSTHPPVAERVRRLRAMQIVG